MIKKKYNLLSVKQQQENYVVLFLEFCFQLALMIFINENFTLAFSFKISNFCFSAFQTLNEKNSSRFSVKNLVKI